MLSQAAERNKQPILDVLQQLLPKNKAVDILEIGSGTGQHVVFFGSHFPLAKWQTSDRLVNHEEIEKTVRAARLRNVLLPTELDVNDFPLDRSYHFVYSANTAHIMSFDEVRCMFAGIAQVLEPGGLFILYGPFNRGSEFTSDSNRTFDVQLRANAGHMGIRSDEDLDQLAEQGGLYRIGDYEMPANNRILVWQQAVG